MKCIDCNIEIEGKSLRCPECKRLNKNLLSRLSKKRNYKQVYEYNKEYRVDRRKKWDDKYYKENTEKCNNNSIKWKENNKGKTYDISYKSYLKRANDLDIIPYHMTEYNILLENPMVLETLQNLKKIKDYLDN